MSGGFAYQTAYALGLTHSTVSCLNLLRHSEYQTSMGWYRNINLLCIDYALRPRLSTRLTLGGRTFPRKPYPYGDMDFNHIYRYSYLDSHFQPVHHRLSLWLRPCWNAFLPLLLCRSRVKAHNFGTSLSPDHFRRRFTRWVSYYALFK